jgi:hypothetical protein
MEYGVRARGERCTTSGLRMGLETATPGMKPHKNVCLQDQTRTLPLRLTSVSLVDGVLILLSVVSLLSLSQRGEPRLSVPHVSSIQLNGKVRLCGDCGLRALAIVSAGTRTSDLRFQAAS